MHIRPSAIFLYKTGSTLITIIGIGHLALHALLSKKKNSTQSATLLMEKVQISFAFAHQTMLNFYYGFSITMAVLFIFTGLQAFALSKTLKELYIINKCLVILPIGISGMTFFLSLRYFIIIPQLLSLLALLSFIFGFVKLRNDPKGIISAHNRY